MGEKPDREQLKTLIRKNSFIQVGRLFGVSDNAVRKWCRSYGLPDSSNLIKEISDEKWEEM